MRVYIASPYTLGDVAVNVRKQIEMAEILMGRGFFPYIPLLSHFQHMIHPRPYEDWMANGKEWLLQCEAVLRLEGESKGADQEVLWAEETGIPVAYSIFELEKHRHQKGMREMEESFSTIN